MEHHHCFKVYPNWYDIFNSILLKQINIFTGIISWWSTIGFEVIPKFMLFSLLPTL